MYLVGLDSAKKCVPYLDDASSHPKHASHKASKGGHSRVDQTVALCPLYVPLLPAVPRLRLPVELPTNSNS